jgi:hypothetical protein
MSTTLFFNDCIFFLRLCGKKMREWFYPYPQKLKLFYPVVQRSQKMSGLVAIQQKMELVRPRVYAAYLAIAIHVTAITFHPDFLQNGGYLRKNLLQCFRWLSAAYQVLVVDNKGRHTGNTGCLCPIFQGANFFFAFFSRKETIQFFGRNTVGYANPGQQIQIVHILSFREITIEQCMGYRLLHAVRTGEPDEPVAVKGIVDGGKLIEVKLYALFQAGVCQALVHDIHLGYHLGAVFLNEIFLSVYSFRRNGGIQFKRLETDVKVIQINCFGYGFFQALLPYITPGAVHIRYDIYFYFLLLHYALFLE